MMMNNMGGNMNPMMMNNMGGNMNPMMMNNMGGNMNQMMNNNMGGNMNQMMNNNMMMNNMNQMMMNNMGGGNMNQMMMNNMGGNMNPMMMNNMNQMMMNNMGMTGFNMNNQMMMNPMMMNNMNLMMMNNMGMNQMNNANTMTKMMNILNNSENNNQIENVQNNMNSNQMQIQDLSEQIKKQEEENKKKLIRQIINNERSENGAKHCKELETVSDMAIMGTITRDYITKDTNNNPNKYISTQNALNSPEEYYFILGILSDYLTKQGVITAIEKKDQNQLSKQKLKEIDTFLQFIINGLSNLKKHELKFDFGWEKNQIILSNSKEREDFLDLLRYSLSKGLNIATNQMVLTYPRMGSVLVTVVFRTEDFNNISVNQLQNYFSIHAPSINHLISIESNLVLDGILLNPELLDNRGNNLNQGWEIGGKRGGRPYYPPSGWKGYGLRVLGKYDNGNDKWISCNGSDGEWCVAYHGASQKINNNYIMMRNVDDINHPGQKVGEGVYVSPRPNVLDNEGGTVQVGNKRYKIGFMLRVKPDKIRIAQNNTDYWVLNGNSSEIRPYRIMIKEI